MKSISKSIFLIILLVPASLIVLPLQSRKLFNDGVGIQKIAQRYIGTPYKYGGRTPAGFDCSGYTGYVYQNAGYRLPRGAQAQYKIMNPVKMPLVGDLVFFRTSGNKVSHVGIYAGNYRFMHAPRTGKKVSYSDLRQKYWQTRYVGARSIFRQVKTKTVATK